MKISRYLRFAEKTGKDSAATAIWNRHDYQLRSNQIISVARPVGQDVSTRVSLAGGEQMRFTVFSVDVLAFDKIIPSEWLRP